MQRNQGIVWIPEAPGHSGVYANEMDHGGDGKIEMPMPVQPSTGIAHLAKQFATEADCLAWCAANPHPAFVPVEHVFA